MSTVSISGVHFQNITELLTRWRFRILVGASALIAAYYATKKFSFLMKHKPRHSEKIQEEKRNLRKPPGPEPSDENLGNMGDIAAAGSVLQYMKNLHRDYQSDVVSFWMGKRQWYSTASPEHFKQTRHLSHRPLDFRDLFAPIVTEKSFFLFNEEGVERRKIYDKNFSHEELLKMFPSMNEIGNCFLEKIKKRSNSSESLDLLEPMVQTVIETFVANIFGDFFDNEKDQKELVAVYEPVWKHLESMIVEGPPALGSERELNFKEYLERYKKIIYDAIDDRRQKRVEGIVSDPSLLVDSLIDLYGDDNEMIFAEAGTYMVAGIHTVTYALIFALHFLCLNPDIQEKIAMEALEVVGKENLDNFTFQHVADLHFCRAFLYETLRFQATTTSREAPEDLHFDGYVIPAGSPFHQAIGVYMMNPEFFPEPEKFNPMRFMSEDESRCVGYQFSPYGFAGKRTCPGMKFANQEMIIWIAKWLGGGMRVKIDDEKTGEVEKVIGIVLATKSPIYFFISFDNQM